MESVLLWSMIICVDKPMIDEVVIHIGMHKTGTSSIQECLRGFDDGNTRYARFGPCNHSVAAKTVFEPNPYDYHMNNSSGHGPTDVDEMKEKWRAQLLRELSLQRSRLLISGEDISLFTHNAALSLKQFLEPHCKRISILAYVREPLGFIESYMQEEIKHGLASFELPEPGYRDRFEKFIEIFGVDNVYFYEYTKKPLPECSVVSEFCEKVEIPANNVDEKFVNSALSLEATKLLYLFNRSGIAGENTPESYKGRSKLLSELMKIPGEKFQLEEKLLMEHIDQDDLGWIREISGLPLRTSADRGSACINSISRESDLKAIPARARRQLQKRVSERGLPCKNDRAEIELLNSLYNHFKKKSGDPVRGRIKRTFSRLAP